jgi:hypothetical protein
MVTLYYPHYLNNRCYDKITMLLHDKWQMSRNDKRFIVNRISMYHIILHNYIIFPNKPIIQKHIYSVLCYL